MNTQQDFQFVGFSPANTTAVPDVLFDTLLPHLNEAQLKVLLYIIRRTLGFKKTSDAISLKQFRYGITTRDGKLIDKGCGLKNFTSITKALKALEEMHCIESEKRKTTDGDQAITVYRIFFSGATQKVAPTTPTVVPTAEKGGRVLRQTYDGTTQSGGQVLRQTEPQETVIQETVIQETVIQQTVLQESNNAVFIGIEPSAFAHATAASQDAASLQDEKQSSSPSETAPIEQPQRTRKTLKSKLIALEDFNFELENTIENITALGDTWRGGPLPAVKRADSDYQKALLQGATPLSQRQRQDGRKGYTLREIDKSIRFFKRIAPEGKPWLVADEWWQGKPIDLWVIARNIDKALDEMEKLEKQHERVSSQSEVSSSPSVQEAPKQVLWTRTPEDAENIAAFKVTRRDKPNWESLRDKIHWEYMSEQEARSHGWTAGRTFTDRDRRELFAAQERIAKAQRDLVAV